MGGGGDLRQCIGSECRSGRDSGFELRHAHRICTCMEVRAQLGKVQRCMNEGSHQEVIGLMLQENKVAECACCKMG